MRSLTAAIGWIAIAASVARADTARFAVPTLAVKPAAADPAVRAFAVSPDGKRLAYVEVDRKLGPTAGTLRVVEIPGGKEEASVAEVPYDLEAIHWVSADQIVFVERDRTRVHLRSVPIKGPLPTERLGPFDRAAVAMVGGNLEVITYGKTTAKKQTVHQIAGHDPVTLKQARTASLAETDGFVTHPGGKVIPLWWIDGSTTLVGRRPGAYDPKKDIRLPHEIVRLDVFSGKIEVAPLPVDGFARVTAEHRARPARRSFVFPWRDVMRLVSRSDMRSIKLARAVKDYYPGSFHTQDLPGDRVLFSATSQRTRTEPDGIELYVVDAVNGEPKPVAVLAGQQSFVEWHAAGGKLALLRKKQGARVGWALEIYNLALP